MDLWELLLTAAALAMDCVAVSVAGGLAARKQNRPLPRLAVETSLLFGAFQAGMLAVGFVATQGIAGWVAAVDHWIAFGLLGAIGGKMIYEVYEGDEDESAFGFTLKQRLLLAVATSIDALAVGVSFSLLDISLWQATLVVGLASFLLSLPAFLVGNRLGHLFSRGAELAGGLVLIGIGLKIVAEHLGYLG